MDLWIRSQDGEDLWKANAITIQDYAKTKAVTIVVSSGVEQIKHFATYKTKEKALKVLDEIQNELLSSTRYMVKPNSVIIEEFKNEIVVYEMPADDEVK